MENKIDPSVNLDRFKESLEKEIKYWKDRFEDERRSAQEKIITAEAENLTLKRDLESRRREHEAKLAEKEKILEQLRQEITREKERWENLLKEQSDEASSLKA